MKKNNQATKPPQKSVLTIEWDEESMARIRTLLDEWQRTGDLGQLADLVKWHPVALAFPQVFKEIFALRRVLNQAGEEDLDRVDGECVTLARGQEKLLARGEKRDAEAALYNILSVWIQRMLPGHTVGPLKVRKRRGRPHNWDSEMEVGILADFNRLLNELGRIEKGGVRFFLRKDETQTTCVKRIEQIVQGLYHFLRMTTPHMIFNLENPSVSGNDIKTSDPYEEMSMVERTLGKDIVSSIAERLVSGGGKPLSTNALLYDLLAFYYFNDLSKSESIRGTIERAEGNYPKMHQRKAPKSC